MSSRLKYWVILLKVYFSFFYLILIIPSSLRCRQDQFAVYIFLTYCQLTAETISEALKGGGEGRGEGERGSLFISNIFDWAGGGLIERWACLIWGFYDIASSNN